MDVPGVDVKVDATADLTPAVKAGSDIATNTHKGVSKLFYALCGPWMEERVSDGRRNDFAYGVVVTLHEINGINRVDEFESACLANGWLVNRVNVTERVEIHNRAEEEIQFE